MGPLAQLVAHLHDAARGQRFESSTAHRKSPWYRLGGVGSTDSNRSPCYRSATEHLLGGERGHMQLIEAQARQALEQLQHLGWAVGPPAARDEWRKAVRAEARRIGLRIRTGEAEGNSALATDGQLHPWAVTVAGYEGLRAQFGGMNLNTVGTMVVTADAGRRVANSVGDRPPS